MEKTGFTGFIEKVQNESASILNGVYIFFAALMVILEMVGWQLVPFSEMLMWSILMLVIVLFFCLALRTKAHKSGAKTLSCNMLPLTGALFGLWAVTFFQQSGLGATLAVMAVLAAMVIGLNQGDGTGIGGISKVLGVLISVVIVVIMGASSMLSGFAGGEPVSKVWSPDGTYLAGVYSADLGATGADSAVSVRRELRKIPTPFGWICDVDEAVVYSGEYNPSLSVTWKDADTLLVGQSAIEMSEYFD